MQYIAKYVNRQVWLKVISWPPWSSNQQKLAAGALWYRLMYENGVGMLCIEEIEASPLAKL